MVLTRVKLKKLLEQLGESIKSADQQKFDEVQLEVSKILKPEYLSTDYIKQEVDLYRDAA